MDYSVFLFLCYLGASWAPYLYCWVALHDVDCYDRLLSSHCCYKVSVDVAFIAEICDCETLLDFKFPK